jgi:hypothetical protein
MSAQRARPEETEAREAHVSTDHSFWYTLCGVDYEWPTHKPLSHLTGYGTLECHPIMTKI